MRKSKNNKKGITLVELLVSVLFITIILAVGLSAWSLSGSMFKSGKENMDAYTDIRTIEAILESAVAVCPSDIPGSASDAPLVFTSASLDREADRPYTVFSFAPTENGKPDVFRVSYYGKDPHDAGKSTTMILDFPTITEVQFTVVSVGRRCELNYCFKAFDDTDYELRGGVVLNNVDEEAFTSHNFIAGAPVSLPQAYTLKPDPQTGDYIYLNVKVPY